MCWSRLWINRRGQFAFTFSDSNQFHVNNRRCLLLDPCIHLCAAVFNTKLTSKFKHHGKRNLMLGISTMLHSFIITIIVYIWVTLPCIFVHRNIVDHHLSLPSQIALHVMTLTNNLVPLPCTYTPILCYPTHKKSMQTKGFASSFTPLFCFLFLLNVNV